MGFTVSSAALGALSHANRNDPGYTIALAGGDLNQMGTQYEFLRARGHDVGRRDVYPAFRNEEDLKKGLEAIWKARVAGWWNLQWNLTNHGICTAEEFKAALDKL
jgi:hypothetical protein